MYLFDTNILSEIRKIHDPKTPPQFTAWFDSMDLDRCYLCVITLLEIEQGILRVRSEERSTISAPGKMAERYRAAYLRSAHPAD